MAINEKAVKIAEWEKELAPIITEIAQQESMLAIYKTLDPEEKAGERDAEVNGKAVKVNVPAKDAIKNVEAFLEKANQHKNILFELIKNA